MLRRQTLGWAVAVTMLGWAFKRWTRFEVTGSSMAPALLPGDRLLVLRTRAVRSGDVVVLSDPRSPELLITKRVADVAADGRVTVLGDAGVQSTDSRVFGAVPATTVHGRVVYRYAPPERAGLVRRWRVRARKAVPPASR